MTGEQIVSLGGAPHGLAAAPADEETYRQFVFQEHVWDLRVAGKLAVWHIFAAPSIGAILASSEYLAADAARRSANTSVMIGDLIEHGPDSPVGRRTIRAMNAMHRGVSAQDMTYALAALTVVPVRWLARYGRRPATAAQAHASADFYGRLGRHMGLPDVPDTYDGMVGVFDTTQWERILPNPASRLASQRVIDHIASRLGPLGRFVEPVLACLLPRAVATAVGLASPSGALALLVHGGLKARQGLLRLLPQRRRRSTPRTRRGLPPAS